MFDAIETGKPIAMFEECILDWHDRPIAAIARLVNNQCIVHLLVAFDLKDHVGVRIFIPVASDFASQILSLIDSGFDETRIAIARFAANYQGKILCILEQEPCIPLVHKVVDKVEVSDFELVLLDVDSTMNNSSLQQWEALFQIAE